jgi:O-acetyl-ADP-ribose deacetylase
MPVTIVHGDLLDQDVDAIVNVWNRNVIPWWLLVPQGVSRAIKQRAGHAPFRELAKLGPIPLGEAVVTSAGKLPHRAIIHVAGINLLWFATEASIRERGFASVAMPLIGAGTGGRRQERVLEWMREAAERADFAGDVRIVVFGR